MVYITDIIAVTNANTSVMKLFVKTFLLANSISNSSWKLNNKISFPINSKSYQFHIVI